MNERRIDAILFDLGGVLVELSGIGQMLSWSRGISDTTELWQRWLHSPAVRRFETGVSSPGAFAADAVAEFALPVTPDEFLREFTRWPRALFPGAMDLLESLAPRFHLASVSNTNEIHWRRFRDEWSLDRAFAHNFPSHAIGRMKPDRDYFEHVLGTIGVPAKRVLFVDDNAINVEGAARLGIIARQAAGPDDVRKIVAELGE
jgi:HAD superfamily hydrolase (TIGR01509 family)